jgi:hypothetical protein
MDLDLLEAIGGHRADGGVGRSKALGDRLAALGTGGVCACRLGPPVMLRRVDGQARLSTDRFPRALYLGFSVGGQPGCLVRADPVQQASVGLRLRPGGMLVPLQLL